MWITALNTIPELGDLLVDFFIRDSNFPAFTYFAATNYPADEAATTRIYSFNLGDESGITGYFYGDSLPYGLVTEFGFDRASLDTTDWYSLNLKSNQSASIALDVLEGRSAQLVLTDSAGTVLALGSTDLSGRADQLISNFVSDSSGTYYLQVISSQGVKYSLVATLAADLESEANNFPGEAQDLVISNTGWGSALGYLEGLRRGLLSDFRGRWR